MRRLLLALPALAALAAAPAPEAPLDGKAKVDEIFKEFDRSDSPGCALGIFQDGRIVYARGYGMANLELGVALTPQSVLDLASVGKQFTAFAIHLLARDGRLSLDDDVRKWVPEIPSYGKTIRVRHLLHHTGGLRDYLKLLRLAGVLDEDLTTEEDALAVLARQKAPNFPPGEEYLYSNSGYFLLSVIVKRASGKSLRDLAAERIFGPLSMTHTQYNDDHARIIPNRAMGYRRKDGAFEIAMSDFEQNGDGGVLTSIEDLHRWDANFFDPTVGDAKLLEAMQAAGALNSGRKLDYASGLRLGSHRGLPTVHHGGSWVGYRAQVLRFPQQRFTVACLCNLGEASPGGLAARVAEVYLGDLMTPPVPKAPSLTADEEVQTGAARPAQRWAPTPPELARFAGAYASPELDTTWRLAVEGDGLVIRHRGMSEEPLSPTVRDAFTIDGMNLAFRRAPGRKASGFTLDAGRDRGLGFTRVAE